MNGGNPHKTPADALLAQLQELGGLRNASARDATFKAWRQNTLTLIQRVWADDDTRAERFRRIPFSTPSSKSSANATRQNFERGCSEAIWLLREWIEDARKSDLKFGDTGSRSAPSMPGSQEDDFPVLDLPADGSTAGQHTNQAVNTTPIGPDAPSSSISMPRAPSGRSDVPQPPLVSPFAEPLELPPAPKPSKQSKPSKPNGHAKPAPAAKAAPAPPAPKQPVAAKAAPAPPAPKPSVATKAPAPPAPKQPVVAKAPPAPEPPPAAAQEYAADLDAAFKAFTDRRSADKPPRSAPPASSTPPQRSAPPKRALKEMLGFTDESGHSLTEEPFEFPHAQHVQPSLPAEPAPAPPAALSGPLPAGPADAADDPGIGIEWESDEALGFAIVEPPEAPPEPPISFMRPGAAKIPASYDEADMPQFENVSEEEELEAEAPVAEAQPPAAPRTVESDEAAEMNDFLNRSPVLGASPKPVPPRAAPLRSPTGSSLATLAAEVGHLGVAEGHRAAVRAMLLDLAREFDENRASWDTIRHTVVFVMEYPALARRVLPLLMPYLDRAA